VEVAVCAPNSHILRANVRIRGDGDGKFICKQNILYSLLDPISFGKGVDNPK
jgi:hypothetical protein